MSTRPPRRVVLLRGINTGRGGRIAMADLRAVTERAGCADVATVLATGNVVLTDPRPAQALRSALEQAYSEAFGYSAIVQVLDMAAVAEAARAQPFAPLEGHHHQIVFVDDPELVAPLATAMGEALDAARAGGTASDTELLVPGPNCVHWRVPQGSTTSSAAGRVLTRAAFRDHVTTRNLRTVRSIAELG